MATTTVVEAGWSDQQRAMFQAQMAAWQKDEVVGVLLALFLGTFGAHHFYLRRTGLGIVYAIFSFTGIPTIISLVECFFMPGRVRQYNLALAAYFTGQVAGAYPASTSSVTSTSFDGGAGRAAPAAAMVRTCEVCGTAILPEARFCGRCGTQVRGIRT